MRHTIIHICTLLVALLLADVSWGQTWENWSGNIAGGIYSGYKKLTGNVTITGSGSITIKENDQLTIDLNGYKLTGCNTTYGHVFYDDHSTTLTIVDNSAAKSGIITGGTGDRGGCLKVYGKFYFNGGTILNCHPRFNNTDKNSNQSNGVNALSIGAGGAIYIGTGGYVEMNGGNIKNCYTHSSATSINGGGTYYSNVGYGGAVFIHGCEVNNTYSMTAFVMNSGTIEGCESGSGGAVYIYTLSDDNLGRRAVFTMNGGTIKNCRAAYKPELYSKHGGGAVSIDEFGEFYMNNGTIEGCETNGSGCGVHARGKMAMSGNSRIINCKPIGWVEVNWDNTTRKWTGTGTQDGDIIDDYLFDGGTLGGGILIYGEKAFVEMTGGEISNNRAGSGGGVLMWYSSRTAPGNAKGGKFVMNGHNAVIKNNKVYGRGIGNGAGVYVAGSTFQFINGIIEDNVARRYGGGINTHHEGIILMEGRCIVRNNVAMHGGGISQEVGKCDITLDSDGILIEGNYAHGIGYGKSSTTGSVASEEGLGNGGGIFAEQGALTIKKGEIRNNIATGHGGGVVLRTRDENVTIDAYLEGGKISGNTAWEGGGVYVNVNDAGSTAQMTVGTMSSEPEIVSNTAIVNGGGLGLNNGDITIIQGTIDHNKAENGGGVYVENGDVIIEKGAISHNEASMNGGGLYVYNSKTDSKEITFSGGMFIDNHAKNGGGVCANGILNVDIDATIEGNTANNGGGLCLLNGAVMDFGDGLIHNNKAVGTTSMSTAYHGTTETLNGVGGGIFLDTNTKLSFSIPQNMGLFNNKADIAADDIFANGNGTEVLLPEVNTMQLKGFEAPTTYLYWIEDYMTGDVEYQNGTNRIADDPNAEDKNVYRYQYALKNFKMLWQLKEENNKLQEYKFRYLCLALGYEQAFLKLVKRGLLEGDNAAFLISYPDPNAVGTYKEYCKVYMYGIQGKDAINLICLPVGDWKVEETSWTSKYEIPAFEDNGHIIEKGDTYVVINVERELENILTITNTLKETYEKIGIRAYESHKINRMTP